MFDAIHTAQDIGCYKPSPRNIEHLLREQGNVTCLYELFDA